MLYEGDRMRAVGNRTGTFDTGGAVQDIIDTDAQQGPLNILTGAADAIPSPNGSSFGINQVRGGNFIIASAGVDAITLGAPVAGTDDGITCLFQDVGGHAHTVTSTGNLITGAAGVNTATFNGNKGSSVLFRAYQGKWGVLGAIGVAFS
jgi:hypothetical protein